MIENFKSICEFKRNIPAGKSYSISDPTILPVTENLQAIKNFFEAKFKTYKGIDLKFEYSKGQGNFPNILHVTILPPGPQVSKGIYVGLCFDINGRGALAGCVESATNPQGLNTVVRKKHGVRLTIDVDGRRPETKYNNCFENPKEFYPESIDEPNFIAHMQTSLELAFFHLKLADIGNLSTETLVASSKLQDEFDPANDVDARKKVAREITARRGQKKFRNTLMVAYNYRCAVTGCDVADVLEAAHIKPYSGDQTNHVQNGLLLRSDIHVLFDLGLLSINADTYKIQVHERLKSTAYYELNDKKMNLPSDRSLRPHPLVLKEHNLAYEKL